METVSKYAISIVFVAILCILINGNTEVVAEGSKDKQAWVSKGDALNRMGNFSQAITAYDTALKIDSNHLDGLVFKAQALYNIGNYTGAKYYSDKAFEIDPKSPALEITRSL